jgi:hypothetical protein
MVILPLSGPVACGVNVTSIVQLPPTGTLVFAQLSLSLKLPLIAIDVTASARLPVFSSVTLNALPAVPNA